MAIYSFKMSNISRSGASNKNNVVAHSAYINRAKFEDERTGTKWNWSKRNDELYISEVMLPTDAPREYSNPEFLWNAVEKNEKRKDARLAKDFIIALPTELTAQQNHSLVRDFIRSNFTSKGIVAEYAIHDIDSHNPHLHLMIAERRLTVSGFEKTKIPELTKVDFLEDLRKEWADCQNKHLHKYDHQTSVSHKKLSDQFLDEMNKYDSAISPNEKAEHFIKAMKLDRQPLTYINRNEFSKMENINMRKDEKEKIEQKKKEAELDRKKVREYEMDQEVLRQRKRKELPCEKVAKKVAKNPPKNTQPDKNNSNRLEVQGSPDKTFGSILSHIIAKILAGAHNFMVDRIERAQEKRLELEHKEMMKNKPKKVKRKRPTNDVTPKKEMGPSQSPILGMDDNIKLDDKKLSKAMQFKIDKDIMKVSFNKKDISKYEMSFDIKNRNNVLSKSGAKPEKPNNLVMSQRFKNNFDNFSKALNNHIAESKDKNKSQPNINNSAENNNVQRKRPTM